MYLVIEMQKTDEDTMANIVWSFSDQNEAESKYHAVLSSAAVSSVPVHSAVIVTEQAYLIEGKFYEHRQEEPQEEESQE